MKFLYGIILPSLACAATFKTSYLVARDGGSCKCEVVGDGLTVSSTIPVGDELVDTTMKSSDGTTSCSATIDRGIDFSCSDYQLVVGPAGSDACNNLPADLSCGNGTSTAH
ncbi:hypothetical protein LX32DRAFT_264397 [Colletotrichum zoysiae]|uniref:Uncharacterized protein n=1 Tax=Colletotrichum zoysiae TaxID=1216348 RepID=A0AAD9H3R1_9PEZI|nr:hypothetical protein LX32DRAFT_264397 [Colletotrichum zoysiae]